MKKIVTTSLSILTTIALLGLSNASAAKELWVIRDGKLNKEGLDSKLVPGKGYVYCGGETVDGLHVVTRTAGGVSNWARFITAKSAVGDCEFRAVFSCAAQRPKPAYPKINITDRGALRFSNDGSQVWLHSSRATLPLEHFSAPLPANAFDGNLHSMAVKRVGDKISFYYDDKKFNEQPIDPDVNLHLWFDALFLTAKIKSIKLTAEKLSDKLTTGFASAAPIEEIYKGSGAREKPEYGKACRYRIPALAVSTKGTILAFAEARRTGGGDIGDIDAVLRRSEDGGKTWKPGGALHANIGESKCAELPDGSVLFVGNPTPPEKRRRLTIITEGGTKNATELWHAEDLKHAGCQGAVARHSWPQDGKPGLLLYSGPGIDSARAHGTLFGSYDDGKTWPWKLEYYEGGSGHRAILSHSGPTDPHNFSTWQTLRVPFMFGVPAARKLLVFRRGAGTSKCSPGGKSRSLSTETWLASVGPCVPVALSPPPTK